MSPFQNFSGTQLPPEMPHLDQKLHGRHAYLVLHIRVGVLFCFVFVLLFVCLFVGGE